MTNVAIIGVFICLLLFVMGTAPLWVPLLAVFFAAMTS